MIERRPDGQWIPTRDSLAKTPGYVVDSILPRDEDLRRFRAAIPGPPPTALSGGRPSLRALMADYVAALAARDTAAVAALTVNRAEYAYLYFPDSQEEKHGFPVAVAWLLSEEGSGKGVGRALERLGGTDARLVRADCGAAPKRQGRQAVWGPCRVTVRHRVGERTLPLANAVVERGGQFKLVSGANEL
jgi:hypothetical protein